MSNFITLTVPPSKLCDQPQCHTKCISRTTSYEPLQANCTDATAEDCTHYRRVSGEREAIDDATAGMLIVILLFVIPARPNFWPITSE